MSLTVFFALCVLGADFMIYFFFKLMFSEKYRSRAVNPRNSSHWHIEREKYRA